MIRIRFLGRAGGDPVEAVGAPGERLLDLAQGVGQPLEGTCDGAMACSTCHVIVAPEDFARLPPASDMEEDMLDLAAGATRTSRLACQILLDATLDGMTVRVPGEAHDWSRA